jgi:hypothetical protein
MAAPSEGALSNISRTFTGAGDLAEIESSERTVGAAYRGVFDMLKVSARNCKRTPSRMGNTRLSDTSALRRLGPRAFGSVRESLPIE